MNLTHKWVHFTHRFRHIRLVNVDFQKHWARVFLSYRYPLIFKFVIQGIQNLSWTLLPIAISYSFVSQDIYLIGGIVLSKIFIETLSYIITFKSEAPALLGITESVSMSATKYFLTVDPVFHSLRESGKIHSKVLNGSKAYGNLIDIIVFNFLENFIGIFVVAFTLNQVSTTLALIATITILITMAINIIGSLVVEKGLRPLIISNTDQEQQVAYENLQQTLYIRANFATENQLNHHYNQNSVKRHLVGSLWDAHGSVFQLSIIPFYATLAAISMYLVHLSSQGQIEAVVAAGYISTYFLATGNIFNIGHSVRQLTQAYTEINDLFKFVRNYGSATYQSLTK